MLPQTLVPRLSKAGWSCQVDALSASRGVSLYIDFHSNGQYILWRKLPIVRIDPRRYINAYTLTAYGYDCAVVAPDDAALSTMASRAASVIRGVSGTAYTIGNACRALYTTTGDSTDYIHGIAKYKYTYTFELRDKRTFLLPVSQIQLTCRET